jgi:hypothetical protein
MSSSRKQTQHARRVSFIARFAENLAIDDDNRVGTQDKPVGLLEEYGVSLLPRQAFCASARALSG